MINKIIASKSSPLARGVAGGTRRGVDKIFILHIVRFYDTILMPVGVPLVGCQNP